jgi:hypothetical protein
MKKEHVIDGVQSKPGLQFHAWPAPDEHLWGPWHPNTDRKGAQKATKYRSCLHSKCNAAEVIEVQ